MKISTQQLLSELAVTCRKHIEFAENLNQKSDEILRWRKSPDSWNILECLEHLNLYGNYYIPEIEKAIENSNTKSEAVFRSGILGNYFAQSMLPKQKLNKMKTPKDKNPLHSDLDRAVIAVFISQQKQMINLLESSKKISLNKVKIAISITKWIRLKLGDVFRFIIYHNIRHIKQIELQLGL